MSKPNYKLFLTLLVFLPLVFGPLDRTTAILLVNAALIIVLLRQRVDVRQTECSICRVPGMLPLFFLAGFMLCQVVPLPPIWIKLISPKTWELYHETIWVVRPAVWMPLSVAPLLTLQVFFRYSLYVLLYFLTVQALNERERIHKTIHVLALFAGLFSFAEIFLTVSDSNSGLPWAAMGHGLSRISLTSQTCTGWVIAVFPLLLGLFLAFRPRIQYGTLAEKFLSFFKNPSSHQYVLHSVLVLLLATAIILGHAVAGTVTGAAIFAALMLTGRKDRKNGVFLLTVAILVAGTGILWNRVVLPERTPNTVNKNVVLKADPVSLIRDYVVTGTGFGTYSIILPRYQTTQDSKINDSTDFFKYFCEGGVIGLFFGGCFLFSLMRKTFPRWLQRRNRTAVYLYPGALAGLAAVLVDGVIHLNHIGGEGITFFFLAGVAVSAANIRSGEKRVTDLTAINPFWQPYVPLLAVGVFALSLAFNGGVFLGKHNLPHGGGVDNEGMAASLQNPQVIQRLAKQGRLDPLDPGYPYALAQGYLASGDYDNALAFLSEALRLSPMNGAFAQAMGLALAHQGDNVRAEKLLRAGLKNDPQAADRYKEFAFWLFSKKKMREGLAHIAHALQLAPEKTATYLEMMDLYKISTDKMRQVLPAKAVAYLAFGNFLLAKGKEKAAEKMFQQATDFAQRDESDTAPFWQLYRYYLDRNRTDEALQVIQAGIRTFPKEANFRILAASLYERLGITFKAVEEYRNALLLDPHNRSAQERLAALSNQ